jgi:hypothetical protein
MHESYMFPLLVKKELDCWPEKNIRKRRWVCVNVCCHGVDREFLCNCLRGWDLI